MLDVPLMKGPETPTSAEESFQAPPAPPEEKGSAVEPCRPLERRDGSSEPATALPPEAAEAEPAAPSPDGGHDEKDEPTAATAAEPSEGGGKKKDGISEPYDDDRELVIVTESGVAEEKKVLPLDADAMVTVAIAGIVGEKGLEAKEGDGGSVAVTVAPRKHGHPRTSCYHGVTRHRWTGKFEAHIWDGTINIESRKRKGKQVYLGSYESEEKAARAHDLAALKYWGPGLNTKLNFPVPDYEKELEIMKNMSQDEFVAYVRRQSSCFSRGASPYRGVTRRKDGKWQSRIGRVGKSHDAKDIYLGTYDTEEEAAEAYDIAAVKLRGVHAVTNFNISNYYDIDVRRIE